MQMLYNSDSYAVVQLDIPGLGATEPARGGYEIVDKFARKDIYIEGVLAESFKAGVQALIERDPTPDAMDEFIAGYTLLAQQPLTLH
jgi:hypothetical protein